MELIKCNWANYQEMNSDFYKKTIEKNKIEAWSRKYEYPFVMENIGLQTKDKKILEAGALGSLIPHIFCENNQFYNIDIDCKILNAFSGCKNFVSDLCKTRFEDNFFDFVTCISVLEHLPNNKWKNAIDEFNRITKVGGKIIITLDVAYTKNCPFNFSYSELEKFFEYLGYKIPEKPSDIIKSDDSENGSKSGPGLQVLAIVLEK